MVSSTVRCLVWTTDSRATVSRALSSTYLEDEVQSSEETAAHDGEPVGILEPDPLDVVVVVRLVERDLLPLGLGQQTHRPLRGLREAGQDVSVLSRATRRGLLTVREPNEPRMMLARDEGSSPSSKSARAFALGDEQLLSKLTGEPRARELRRTLVRDRRRPFKRIAGVLGAVEGRE
jgi:hypothetical protein